MGDAVRAVYYVETRIALQEAAERLANEQSAGLSDNDIVRSSGLELGRSTARVTELTVVEPSEVALHLPLSHPAGSALSRDRTAGLVTVEYDTLEPGFGAVELMNVVLGEPQNLGVLNACRLSDLDPHGIRHWEGPAFGIEGIRAKLGIQDRPLCCAPIKPSTGLDVAAHVQRGVEAAVGGADIVKDDELCHDTTFNPLSARISLMVRALREADLEKNERTLYVANLIGSRASLEARLRVATDAGAEAVMVAPSLMGFDVVEEVRALAPPELFVFAHSSFTTCFTRVPTFGMDLSIWVTLQRGMGADAVLLPSTGGSFGIAPGTTSSCVAACTSPVNGWRSAFPAHSGSMNVFTLPLIAEISGSPDFIFTSGSGLFDHPEGATKGARELREALGKCNPQPSRGWGQKWVQS